mgnify:CR=1 FL=1
MDFTLDPAIDDVRRRVRRFVDERLIPLEVDRANYDEHENAREDVLAGMRSQARAEGLWALQMPKARGGGGLSFVGMAACYEEMNRSIFGPATFKTRFSIRTPHWPSRYRPGSTEVIIPGSIAMFASGTALLMLCGPSCTLRK